MISTSLPRESSNCSDTMNKTALVVCGTRPEAIKLAPVIRALKDPSLELEVRICVTGQHREMLDQVLNFFDIHPDIDLNLMKAGQTLSGFASAALVEVGAALEQMRPDYVVVQGDTTTAFASALAAFYQGIPVGHVEAGLRTGDPRAPFPEEANRRFVAVVATQHFAPTESALSALIREGVRPDRIEVTGNTVVDALAYGLDIIGRSDHYRNSFDERLRALTPAWPERWPPEARLVLITGHRRESFGEGLRSVCLAVRDLAGRFPGDRFVYPAHLNPEVQRQVQAVLSALPNVFVMPPVDYPTMLQLMQRAHLILTDSGGIQEEAPSLRVPTLVMRGLTERSEGVAAGGSILVGTDRARIVEEAATLLSDSAAHARMQMDRNPYGDGQASQRIAAAVGRYLDSVAVAECS